MIPNAQTYRQAFDQQGYLVFENVLSPDDLADANPIFDAFIPPDAQPPKVTGDANERNGRKQLSGKCCEPRLANFAGHPRLLEAVEALLGPHFRLLRTPTPCVTYKSPPGGERFDLGYHVDWPHTPPEAGDERGLNCVLHFSSVEPGGGAFMVCPGSHDLIRRSFDDPGLSQRAFKQDFQGFPGLSEPKEMCVPAGSALFYHPFLVHDRSENLRDQPRKVLFAHFKGYDSEQDRQAAGGPEARQNFHPDHLAAMDPRLRCLCAIA